VALAARLTLGGARGVLNIVSGTSYTYGQALDAITRLTGRRPAVASRARTKARVDHRFDPSRLLRECHGFAFTSLEEGLRRMLTTTAAAAAGAR
jgi:nucleoside-diphosphate-sugar epimerase